MHLSTSHKIQFNQTVKVGLMCTDYNK